MAFSAFNALRNKLSFEWSLCFWIGRWNGSSFSTLASSETSNGELPRISLEFYLIFNLNLSSGVFNRTILSKMAHFTWLSVNISEMVWYEVCITFRRLRTPAVNGKHLILDLNLIKRTKIIFNFSFSMNYFSVQFTDEIITTNMLNKLANGFQ